MTEKFNPDPNLVSETLSELSAYRDKLAWQSSTTWSDETSRRRALELFKEQTEVKMGVLMNKIKQKGFAGYWHFNNHPYILTHEVTLTTPGWIIVANSKISVQSLRNPDVLKRFRGEFTDLHALLGGQYLFPFFPSELSSLKRLMEYREYKTANGDVANLCKRELWDRMGWEPETPQVDSGTQIQTPKRGRPRRI